jgi:hypothetical protein
MEHHVHPTLETTVLEGVLNKLQYWSFVHKLVTNKNKTSMECRKAGLLLKFWTGTVQAENIVMVIDPSMKAVFTMGLYYSQMYNTTAEFD